MKKLRKLSLKEELEKEAAEIEKELEDHPELDDLKVSKELDDAIYEKIRQYEKDQEENKVKELPIRTYKKKKRAKLIVALVAILVLVMGMSMSSVGSKSYMKELIEKFTGKSQVDVMNVKDMKSKEAENQEEAEAYQKIDEVLGGKCVRIQGRPKAMYYENYEIDNSLEKALVFYKYQDKIIRYEVYLNQTDSSQGATKEDPKINEYKIDVQGVKIKVEEHKVEKTEEVCRIAEFEYKGIYYCLKGQIEKEDINEILKNLYFF